MLLADPNLGSVIHRGIDFAVSPYPPSFDNNPMVFGWALFARLLVTVISLATLVRIRSRNITDRTPPNHPVYYHRMVTTCFLWALALGAGSDVITYLFWGEVTDQTTGIVLLIARFMDALTMVPFLMALFVPIWLRWLCRIGVLHNAPTITLNGVVNDIRVTWDKATIPLTLLIYSAAASAMVTAGKYLLWIGHAHS